MARKTRASTCSGIQIETNPQVTVWLPGCGCWESPKRHDAYHGTIAVPLCGARLQAREKEDQQPSKEEGGLVGQHGGQPDLPTGDNRKK